MIKEFFELDPKLRLILCDIENWLHPYNEDITITDLIRSDEEQRELYESGATPYRVSVHQFGRGADFRKFNNDNLNLVVIDYVNGRYPYGGVGKQTLLRHKGTADHFHLQVWHP